MSTERWWALAAALLPLAGCPPEDPGPDPCEEASASILLADENNYSFDGALDIASTPVQPLADIVIDWGAMAHDLLGHEIDPVGEIDVAATIVFGGLTEEEVEQGLSLGNLDQAEMTIFANQQPGDATSVLLSDMFMFQNDFDIETYLEPGSGTWLIALTTGTTPGVGTRMAAFLEPVDGESNTTLTITDTSTVLDFEADLSSLDGVYVPAGEPALSVDWSEVTTDGQGTELLEGTVDQVMLGHYASMEIADLEAQFLDIELIADELYSHDLQSGAELDLSLLQDDGGGAFPGIDGEGTWLLALRCTSCVNPAPPIITILHPCGE